MLIEIMCNSSFFGIGLFALKENALSGRKYCIHSMFFLILGIPFFNNMVKVSVKVIKISFFQVRYEDIVKGIQKPQLKKICDFINVKYESGIIRVPFN